MKTMMSSWQVWALMSAGFAALTAVFAKVGVDNINSDYATLIRTVVILGVATLIVTATGQWQAPGAVGGRTYLFLVLSGLAIGTTVAVLFLDEVAGFKLPLVAAGFFLVALALMMVALLLFLAETRVAAAQLRIPRGYLELEREL